MIATDGLKRHFLLPDGDVKAVDGVTLSVKPGEFLAVMGPSGSGKSTLLYLLGAMDRPTRGWVQVAGKRLDQMNDSDCSRFRNLELGFVFQSFHLLPRLDLTRNVELPLLYAGIQPEVRRKRASALLEAVGIGSKISRFPTELSGGQCQRAAIARALVNKPKLLLCDEATGNLDSRTSLDVMAIFQELNRRGMTIIMVTHDGTMAQHASRVVRMVDGKVVADDLVPDPRQSALPPEMDFSRLDRIE